MEISVHLTGMICPRAGNLKEIFWKMSKPNPMQTKKNTDHLLDSVSTEGKSIHLVFQAELR